MTEFASNRKRLQHAAHTAGIVICLGIGLVILVPGMLTGCARSPEKEEIQTEEVPAEEKPFLLKAATDILPLSEDYEQLSLLKEQIEQRSEGTMEVQLYPGSQLGSQDIILEGLRTGTVEMAVMPLSYIEFLYPDIAGFIAPFQGMDPGKAEEFLASEEMESMLEKLRQETGIRILAFGVKGYRNIWTREEISSVEEIDGLRLYVQDVPCYTEAFRELGAQPSGIPLAQVYDGLRTGVLDGAEMDLETALQYKVWEVCRYCLESSHGVSILAVMISDEIFQMMTEEQRDIADEAACEMARNIQERNLSRNAADRELLEEKGIVFSEPGTE